MATASCWRTPSAPPACSTAAWTRSSARLGDGVALQVNASSLRGDHGLEAQAAAMALLRRRLVLALASDAHPGTRGHTLQLGFDLLLRAGATTERAVRLTQDNPRLLLEQGVPLAGTVPHRLAA